MNRNELGKVKWTESTIAFTYTQWRREHGILKELNSMWLGEAITEERHVWKEKWDQLMVHLASCQRLRSHFPGNANFLKTIKLGNIIIIFALTTTKSPWLQVRTEEKEQSTGLTLRVCRHLGDR